MFGFGNSNKATASARHILVKDRDACERIKAEIEAGADFADMARQHSDCPSGQRGGDLGSFARGRMVKEFDEVVFAAPLHQVQGPVQTQFGYHLIEITARSEAP